jgi:hypothetical protein
MTHEPIAERLEHDWDAFTSHLPHRHPYVPVSVTMQAATLQEAPVSLITEIKTELTALALKAEGIDEAAAAKLETLEGNPVVDELLAVAHVPVGALSIVVSVLKGLGDIYPKPDAAAPVLDAAGQPVPADAAV